MSSIGASVMPFQCLILTQPQRSFNNGAAKGGSRSHLQTPKAQAFVRTIL